MPHDMEALNVRLATIFIKLKDTELVKTKCVNSANIEQFKKVLNLATMVSSYELGAGDFIRFIYKTDRRAFFKCIHILNMVHLALLTDGSAIVSVLGLRGIIIIYWDSSAGEFCVRPYVDKNIKHERTDSKSSAVTDSKSPSEKVRPKRNKEKYNKNKVVATRTETQVRNITLPAAEHSVQAMSAACVIQTPAQLSLVIDEENARKWGDIACDDD